MLALDLGRLEREGRVRLERDIPASDPIWEGADLHWRRPLHLDLEAQAAGHDIVVRGHMTGELETVCRRCLTAVVVGVDEPVSMMFRPGVDPLEAERQEIYPLPHRARAVDLAGPVREAVLLAAPRYALCRDACKGLCPTCGVDRNHGDCGCAPRQEDTRWAALRNLKFE